MDLAIWLPVTFVLGLGGLVLCYLFLLGCEKISSGPISAIKTLDGEFMEARSPIRSSTSRWNFQTYSHAAP